MNLCLVDHAVHAQDCYR